MALEEVAEVKDGYEEPRSLSRMWVKGTTPGGSVGDNAVTLIVTKQSGQNTVELVNKVRARLDELKTVLPEDIQIEIIRDQSRFIRASIEEVKVHLLLAAFLVSLTILLFMRDWRTTVIASLSIPTSMIAAFAFMDVMGYTIDNVTMLAMILAGRVAKGQGDVTKGTTYVRMIDLKQRPYSQFDVMKDARAIMAEYPDLRAAAQDAAALSATAMRQVDIDLNLRGPDMKKLEEYYGQIMAWMQERGGYVDVDTSLSMRKPELRLKPNREKMSDLGVSVQAVAAVTNILVGGEPVGTYKEVDEQYDVWLRAHPKLRDDAEVVRRLAIPSAKVPDGTVKVGNVVGVEEAHGPATIERFRRQRQVVVSANLDGKALGEGVAELDAHLKSMNLPADYRYEFLGRAKSMSETNENFAIAFVLAFVFMYMVLAAQFESFVHPLTILIALPLTIPCAILSLIILQTKLDVFAMFGVFMLFGIVKKNGILQVDYTNHLRARGVPLREAILEANRTRLRPILMTTVMLVAAMVPMALGEGPGAAGRAGMAKVILGGQLLSLLLTLLMTPVAYSLWEDFTAWLARQRARFRKPVEETAAAGHDERTPVPAAP